MKTLREQIEKIQEEYYERYKDGATDKFLQLFQDYAMGCVPPRQYKNSIGKNQPHKEVWENFVEGYNQCRQDILSNIEANIDKNQPDITKIKEGKS